MPRATHHGQRRGPVRPRRDRAASTAALLAVRSAIQSGTSLSDATAALPELFSREFVDEIRCVEAAATLDVSLRTEAARLSG